MPPQRQLLFTIVSVFQFEGHCKLTDKTLSQGNEGNAMASYDVVTLHQVNVMLASSFLQKKVESSTDKTYSYFKDISKEDSVFHQRGVSIT